MHRTPTAEAEVADELAVVRPGLLPRYEAELPGARAAVLSRLWRGLAHDPLPWVARREQGRDGLTLSLSDGRRLHGPRPDPYATGAYVTVVRLGRGGVRRSGAADDGPRRPALRLLRRRTRAQRRLAGAVEGGAGGAPTNGWPQSDWEWEQRIVDGHPFHPTCRSRPGFSVAEQLAYGPEHRPLVELGLVPVRAAGVHW